MAGCEGRRYRRWFPVIRNICNPVEAEFNCCWWPGSKDPKCHASCVRPETESQRPHSAPPTFPDPRCQTQKRSPDACYNVKTMSPTGNCDTLKVCEEGYGTPGNGPGTCEKGPGTCQRGPGTCDRGPGTDRKRRPTTDDDHDGIPVGPQESYSFVVTVIMSEPTLSGEYGNYPGQDTGVTTSFTSKNSTISPSTENMQVRIKQVVGLEAGGGFPWDSDMGSQVFDIGAIQGPKLEAQGLEIQVPVEPGGPGGGHGKNGPAAERDKGSDQGVPRRSGTDDTKDDFVTTTQRFSSLSPARKTIVVKSILDFTKAFQTLPGQTEEGSGKDVGVRLGSDVEPPQNGSPMSPGDRGTKEGSVATTEGSVTPIRATKSRVVDSLLIHTKSRRAVPGKTEPVPVPPKLCHQKCKGIQVPSPSEMDVFRVMPQAPRIGELLDEFKCLECNVLKSGTPVRKIQPSTVCRKLCDGTLERGKNRIHQFLSVFPNTESKSERFRNHLKEQQRRANCENRPRKPKSVNHQQNFDWNGRAAGNFGVLGQYAFMRMPPASNYYDVTPEVKLSTGSAPQLRRSRTTTTTNAPNLKKQSTDSVGSQTSAGLSSAAIGNPRNSAEQKGRKSRTGSRSQTTTKAQAQCPVISTQLICNQCHQVIPTAGWEGLQGQRNPGKPAAKFPGGQRSTSPKCWNSLWCEPPPHQSLILQSHSNLHKYAFKWGGTNTCPMQRICDPYARSSGTEVSYRRSPPVSKTKKVCKDLAIQIKEFQMIEQAKLLEKAVKDCEVKKRSIKKCPNRIELNCPEDSRIPNSKMEDYS